MFLNVMTNSDKLAKESAADVIFPSWARYAFIIMAIVKLWLVSGQTVFAIGYAGHDDRLFLNLTKAFLAHGWLGHYSHLTLIKGPFYPFWIALSFVLGIPLLLSQHLLYIAACVFFLVAVRPLLRKPALLLLVWSVLLFNPMSYTDSVMTRVIREGIYPALTIMVAAFSIGLLVRYDRPLKNLGFWSVGLGFVLSAFWLTREEGVWIIPSILIIIGFAAVRVWQTKLIDWRGLSLLCILPIVIWMAAIGFVAGINKVGYGVFATVEVKSRDFLAAYGALSRVKHAHWRRYVPVPKETRERIYKISPAFAELRPFLEGDMGKGWSVHGCNALAVCEDIAGGWFMWALRDAVAAAGHSLSGSSAANFYRRMAEEINTACEVRTLDCEAERASLMPLWRSEYTRPLLKTIFRAAVFLARFETFNAHPSPSEGTEDSLILFRDLTGGRLSPSATTNQLQFRGWAVAIKPASTISLSVRTSDGALADASMKLGTSPDVYQHFLSEGRDITGARESRFDITTSCTSGCYLHVKTGDCLLARIPLDGSIKLLQTPELNFYLDFFGYKKTGLPHQSRVDDLKIKILNQIGNAYQTVMPILIVFGLIAYIFSTVHFLRTRIVTRLWVINTSLLIAIVTRLFIFSMIDVTSFPGINTMYLSPVYPLLLMFVLLVLTDCRDAGFRPIGKKDTQ